MQTTGHPIMSFMDAYRGYCQIAMHDPDQKTTFITPIVLFCYKLVSVGLKIQVKPIIG